MILRARLKPIEEIPEEAICCEVAREKYSTAVIVAVEVIAGSRRKGECRNCGRVVPNCLSIKHKETVIDPRMWDIEESPEVGEA